MDKARHTPDYPGLEPGKLINLGNHVMKFPALVIKRVKVGKAIMICIEFPNDPLVLLIRNHSFILDIGYSIFLIKKANMKKGYRPCKPATIWGFRFVDKKIRSIPSSTSDDCVACSPHPLLIFILQLGPVSLKHA